MLSNRHPVRAQTMAGAEGVELRNSGLAIAILDSVAMTAPFQYLDQKRPAAPRRLRRRGLRPRRL